MKLEFDRDKMNELAVDARREELMRHQQLCPVCQANKGVWREVFNEEHRCDEDKSSTE